MTTLKESAVAAGLLLDHAHFDPTTPKPPLFSMVQRHVMEEYPHAPLDKGLRKIEDDIWVVEDGFVPLHTDMTRPGEKTIGVCLLNDRKAQLIAHDRVYDFPPGAIYTLDGRYPHGVLPSGNAHTSGLLAFLAWDIDEDRSMTSLHRELMERLEKIARNGLTRNFDANMETTDG